MMAITEGILVGITLIFLRKVWGYAYSNEKEVAKYVGNMLPVLAISNFLDGIQSVLSGTARGCGWQNIGAFINVGAYYPVGIPSAILLAFVLHIGGKAKKATDRVSDSMIPRIWFQEAELLMLYI